MKAVERDLKKEVENQDLVELLGDNQENNVGDAEGVFDADSELMDDNLHQGMRIDRKGKPTQ